MKFSVSYDTDIVIPAVYCTDYYAEEIAAEKNGLSNSTFYSDTYADDRWICPNLTESTILPGYLNNLQAELDACWKAKEVDPDFEPDLDCSANNDTEQIKLMKHGSEYTLHR